MDSDANIESLARSLLRQRQEDGAARVQHQHRVGNHRVGRLRVAKRDAYTPGLVAIGPLHAADSEDGLRTGHHLKMHYLERLVSRGHPDPATHLAVIQRYVRLMAEYEPEARAMYAAEDVDKIRADDLVKMLVLDGCFIIEHLVNVTLDQREPSLHAIPFGPSQLSVDLILAENQLPFFVLAVLINNTRLPEFGTTMAGFDPPALLMKLALYYLAGERGRDRMMFRVDTVSHMLHLLHMTVVTSERTRSQLSPRIYCAASCRLLLRYLLLLIVVLPLHPFLPNERRRSASYGPKELPPATDLKRMCVRFKKARGSGGGSDIASLLGPMPLAVELEHEEILLLPQLRLEFPTEPLLLNLIAFEQSTGQRAGDVSAYAWLMAKLVRSPEDAGVLVAAEVVQSMMPGKDSKEDVASFFQEVGAATEAAAELQHTYISELLGKLRERSHHWLFMMWADVQLNYFTLPWAAVAEFVAFLTFISAMIQIYGVFKKK